MRSVSVPLVTGWVDHFSQEYSDASRSMFPNAAPEGPASEWKKEKVYVCDECVHAKQDWLEAHK